MTYESLLHEITEFCARWAMAETTFGRAARTDPYIIKRLRQGRDVRFSTLLKLQRFMLDYPATTMADTCAEAGRRTHPATTALQPMASRPQAGQARAVGIPTAHHPLPPLGMGSSAATLAAALAAQKASQRSAHQAGRRP
ncbi:hypothetical protein E3E12_07705 [Formicincola oecophyllae]|uniref:Uncharacterized protein n=1 Tax=Formicincola oecophyllae TaxID=2558361 RepID=A0A4Y6UCG4_9PROT|nr:hypothetical protein [Formicincola oecophyllae]QDH14081.1 hypothetical protein E3E12_07705 [Formicincola oecophyllae]